MENKKNARKRFYVDGLNRSVAGQTAEFRCRVAGSPTPTVDWSKGKWRKLTNDAKTRVRFDSETDQYVLEMDAIKKNDAGTYTVRYCRGGSRK